MIFDYVARDSFLLIDLVSQSVVVCQWVVLCACRCVLLDINIVLLLTINYNSSSNL